MSRMQSKNPPVAIDWEKNRSRILEATGLLLMAHGYAGTTMKAVADLAGCSVGYLYKHFADKQDLLNELLVVHLDVKKDIKRWVREEEGLKGLACLRRELELMCEYLVDHRALIPVIAERESSQSGELRRHMVIQRRENIAILECARLAGEIPNMDPAMLAAVIDGAIWALLKDLAQTQRREVFLSIPEIIDRLIFTPLSLQPETGLGKDPLDQ